MNHAPTRPTGALSGPCAALAASAAMLTLALAPAVYAQPAPVAGAPAPANGQAPAPAPAQAPAAPNLQVPAAPLITVSPDLATTGAATDEKARLNSPAMVVDLTDAPEPLVAPPPAAAGAEGKAAPGSSKPVFRPGSDEAFAERINGSEVETAHATRLADNALIAPQGTVISAVLETGINSDLPGFVRAVVSRDVSGFDGSTVLIPRGTKLIGEYKSAVAQGQTRAFVIWSRLLTPEGVSVNLASPATDRLGRGGVEGHGNTHFLQRFGAAILLSVIGAGLDILSNQYSNGNSVNAVVIGTPQQATSVATEALQRDIDIPTTITVLQGQAIRVFVARDLDFSNVVSAH